MGRYRVFNDEGCEFGEPLLYYCNAQDANGDYVCEGARLLLGPPPYGHVPEVKQLCSSGYKHSFPYYNEWPPMGRSKSTGWDAMTLGEPASHGRFDTYGCTDTDCTTKDT